MGSEPTRLIRYLTLTVGFVASASCGILPGRDFSSSLEGAGGVGIAGGPAVKAEAASGAAPSAAAGDAGSAGDTGSTGDTGSAGNGTGIGGDAGKPLPVSGGAPSTVQIRFGAFADLSGGSTLGRIRVLGQFITGDSVPSKSASGIGVRGGFQ